jgi:hypothetical protein
MVLSHVIGHNYMLPVEKYEIEGAITTVQQEIDFLLKRLADPLLIYCNELILLNKRSCAR